MAKWTTENDNMTLYCDISRKGYLDTENIFLAFSWRLQNMTIIILTFDTTIAIMKLRIVCVTNDHGYVPLVVITIRSFPHS
jgi:hypothetical protein